MDIPSWLVGPQLRRTPSPGHETYIFGRHFLDHKYYKLSLPHLCLGIMMKIFKGIMHFHYMTYGHALAKEPCTLGHEIYNFGGPFCGHHYYILGLSEQCLGVEKKILTEIHQYYTF